MQKRTSTKQEASKRSIPLADGRELSLRRPLVMGVLNVTPDSFSDGGRFTKVDVAVGHALKMVEDGADIIDIGGESTRPGADPVSPDEEKQRVLPVIGELRAESTVPISVDTYHASIASAAIKAGADIVNDISALRFDPSMAALVAEARVPVALMHMLGTPKNMQKNPSYTDCVREIGEFFEERIEFCYRSGIGESKIILDPGIGFGKRLPDNLEIIARLGELKRFSRPLLVGASRKSFIETVHPTGKAAEQRLGGSIAAMVAAVSNGADIVRVHDVHQTVEALKVVEAVKQAK